MTETRTAILTYAADRESFRFADLFMYLNELFEISKVALAWYLKQLVNENNLFKLGRGVYTSRYTQTRLYVPELSNKSIRLAKRLSRVFPFITISVFEGNSLNQFQHHLSINNIHYLEVDRDAMEAVFHFLKSEGYTVYLNPDKNFVYDNIDLPREAIIVKPLISESPLMDSRAVKTPCIEKILVDIICDDDMDYLHGHEWNHILRNAFDMYSINRTSMLRYASRRNAKQIIKDAIENLSTRND